jgi:cob(I)alamin adenosyltransferase
MKIYTKTGDNGTTSLFNMERVFKDNILIDLLGDIDELNSYLGIITNTRLLPHIQTWLFDLGTIIANPNKKFNFDIHLEYTKTLEYEIDNMNDSLTKLTNFILPSGFIHLSRTIARRCERKMVEAKKIYNHIDDNCLIFMNRLSDYLFILARYENKNNDVIYKKSDILTPC